MTHQIDINQLIEAFDLRAHVASIWGEGKRNGKVVMYRSRWRSDDDHPSFAVYADGYKDHGGSNEGGGVLDFLCKEHGWTKGEAVDFLRDQTRILPTTARRTEPRKQQDSPLSINWQQQVAERVTVECADILWSKAPRVLDYLRTARGLSDDMIRRLQFGYNPALRRIDYTDENGKQATAWLSPGITIPRRANGMIYAVRTRSRVGNFAEFLGIPDDLDRDGEPLFKYLSLSGSKPSLVPFNADALRFTPGQEIDVLIVEGEIDAATGQQYLGDQVAVITMGSASTAFPAEWYDVLKKARHVYSCMDADGAGQGATQKIAAALGDWHTAITLPDGVKDLNDAVTKNGLDVPKWWAAATAPRSASAPSRAGQPVASDQSASGTLPETPDPLHTPLLGLITALNQYGETGETAIYYLTCATGIQPGELVTLDQLDAAQASCGFSIPRKTLEAYYHASRIILTPIFDDDRGVNFFLTPIHKVKSELCKRAHRAIRVESFRAKDTRQYDPIKGEEYIAPAIPADLPADALAETDLTPAEAAEAAELLKTQPFDRFTEYRRQKARTAATLRYKRFAASLSDTRHIALPGDMEIRKIGDLARAHARVWHEAGLLGQWSVAEQCAALGVTKNTRKTILLDVGIEQDNVEITAEVSGDVQDAVRSTWQQQRAIPRSYKAIDDTGAVVERATYRKADVEAALAKGVRVIVTYSRKVYHQTQTPAAQQQVSQKPRSNKPVSAPIRIAAERVSWARYPRTWVHEQLRLRYRLKFGQDAPQSATARQLVEAISGCKLETSKRFEQNLRLIA